MKKAFTMIELIFVIVILGILAAVALPKFLGVSQQAHEANLKSFVGTLNRTVGPTLWSKSIAEGYNGDISYLNLEYNKSNSSDQNLSDYTDVPKEISIIDLGDCNSTDNETVVGLADKAVAGADYFITCIDGNANKSPIFHLYKTNEDENVSLGETNTSKGTKLQ
jgi:prepilin-type N-terminal cleavage/methylation domain-containing protein